MVDPMADFVTRRCIESVIHSFAHPRTKPQFLKLILKSLKSYSSFRVDGKTVGPINFFVLAVSLHDNTRPRRDELPNLMLQMVTQNCESRLRAD